MKTYTKTLLEELTGSIPQKETTQVIEIRGSHVIASALNLIESIQHQFGKKIAEEMERRLISSIKSKSNAKFARGAKQLSKGLNADEN